ncbi:MAG TPA: hypothetical protein VMV69_27605, partial [Pirellulales bacterium]|nr:hypothetical protein [Pirellulales bacterium]
YGLTSCEASYGLTSCEASYGLTSCEASYGLTSCEASYGLTSCEASKPATGSVGGGFRWVTVGALRFPNADGWKNPPCCQMYAKVQEDQKRSFLFHCARGCLWLPCLSTGD